MRQSTNFYRQLHEDETKNAVRVDSYSVNGEKSFVAYSPVNLGLGNKIKNIVSCQRMVGSNDVFWGAIDYTMFPTKNVNYYFPELNQLDSLDGKRYRASWRLYTDPTDVPDGFSTMDYQWKRYTGGPWEPVIQNKKSLDCEYSKIPERVREIYLKYFRGLKFSDHLLEKVSSYNISDDVVGVHIRSWEDVDSRKYQLFDIDSYISKMNKYGDSQFYLACDDPRITDYLKSIFGENRIITSVDEEDYDEPVIDMLILSQCSNMVLTPFSTFSEVAWWLGGAKLNYDLAWRLRPVL